MASVEATQEEKKHGGAGSGGSSSSAQGGIFDLPHYDDKTWQIVSNAMKTKITSPKQLCDLIMTLPPQPKDEDCSTKGLLNYMNAVPKAFMQNFIDNVLPFMQSLVLELPTLFPKDKAPRLLNQGTQAHVDLTQHQAAALMATGFFAVFPARAGVFGPSPPETPTASDVEDCKYSGSDDDDEVVRLHKRKDREEKRYQLLIDAFQRHQSNWANWNKQSPMPNIQDMNFDGLYYPYNPKRNGGAVWGKLACLLTYFTMRYDNQKAMRSGTQGITIYRRVASKAVKDLFDSDALAKNTTPLSQFIVKEKGSFEDDGAGMLQTDFANQFIGSTVLEGGCVQEQIRFSINPECICSMGFCEKMLDDEAIVITGAERVAHYGGYGNSFTFKGQYNDKTPLDSKNRIATTIVGIDAIKYGKKAKHYQFSEPAMLRDLIKAYVGYDLSDDELGYKCQGNVAAGRASRGQPGREMGEKRRR